MHRCQSEAGRLAVGFRRKTLRIRGSAGAACGCGIGPWHAALYAYVNIGVFKGQLEKLAVACFADGVPQPIKEVSRLNNFRFAVGALHSDHPAVPARM